MLTKGKSYVQVGMNRKDCVEDLDFLADLVKCEEHDVIIDWRHNLAQMADVHRCVEKGHKPGNVVINIAPPQLKKL